MSRGILFNRFIRLGRWILNKAQIGVSLFPMTSIPQALKDLSMHHGQNFRAPEWPKRWDITLKNRRNRPLILLWGMPCYACILIRRSLEVEKSSCPIGIDQTELFQILQPKGIGGCRTGVLTSHLTASTLSASTPRPESHFFLSILGLFYYDYF